MTLKECVVALNFVAFVLIPSQPNVLVDSSGHARVADFGLATVIQGAPHQFVHGARWAAPEVMDEGKHSKEADIFSFAMVTIEVCRGDLYQQSVNTLPLSHQRRYSLVRFRSEIVHQLRLYCP